jgi:hypothetical protein
MERLVDFRPVSPGAPQRRAGDGSENAPAEADPVSQSLDKE